MAGEGSEARASPDARADGRAPPPEERRRLIQAELQALRARAWRLGALRLLSFTAAAAGFLLGLLGSPWLLAGLALPGAAAFLAAFLLHGKVLGRIEELEAEMLLLEEKLERRGRRRRTRSTPPPEVTRWSLGLAEPPEPSFEVDPWVADDLDLVHGPRSLFGFLDSTRTPFGANRLLGMLLRPLQQPAAILRRQEAASFAAREDAFRERLGRALLALGRHPLDPVPAALEAPPLLAGRGLLLAAHCLGTLLPALFLLMALDLRFGLPAVCLFMVNMGLVGLYSRRTNPARERVLLLGPLLEWLPRLEAALAREPRLPEALRAVLSVLAAARPAAARLRRWVRLLALHEFGVVFELFNAVFLWELRILPSAEALRAAAREVLERACRGLGELEALLALAVPLAEEEGFSLPEPLVALAGPLFEARGLGHPLIDPSRLVRNDLRLDAETPVALVTGSNMAGKSTLLKAVGTSLILAGMGGAVQARSLRWTPLAILSDINVRDSLDDGKSYFAAEVERVERILRRAAESPFLLALFDELFRGTNSAERQAIAMALLAHLRRAGGLYLVATHDLAITRLAEEIPGVVNYHLREEVKDGAMTFDYILREGPAPTRNAIRVLEARGYPDSVVREARRRLSAAGPPAQTPGDTIPAP